MKRSVSVLLSLALVVVAVELQAVVPAAAEEEVEEASAAEATIDEADAAAAELALNETELVDEAVLRAAEAADTGDDDLATRAAAAAFFRPAPDLRKCPQLPKGRDGVVHAAKWAVGKRLHYTQAAGPRWSGIAKRKCPTVAMPRAADCSSLVSWYFWAVYGKGRDFLNNQNWRAGYTGTMKASRSGRRVAYIYHAKPGDIILYGCSQTSGCKHVALYVGNNKVVTFGSNLPGKSYGVPSLVNWNYRSDSKTIVSFL